MLTREQEEKKPSDSLKETDEIWYFINICQMWAQSRHTDYLTEKSEWRKKP